MLIAAKFSYFCEINRTIGTVQMLGWLPVRYKVWWISWCIAIQNSDACVFYYKKLFVLCNSRLALQDQDSDVLNITTVITWLTWSAGPSATNSEIKFEKISFMDFLENKSWKWFKENSCTYSDNNAHDSTVYRAWINVC